MVHFLNIQVHIQLQHLKKYCSIAHIPHEKLTNNDYHKFQNIKVDQKGETIVEEEIVLEEADDEEDDDDQGDEQDINEQQQEIKEEKNKKRRKNKNKKKQEIKNQKI